MTTNAIQQVGNVAIDYNAVLKTLNLNPTDPKVQTLVLVCQQYELDPVLKHMVLIQGAAYITHKGLWHMAHRSGLLNGEDIVEQGETDKEWWAKVSIYRKDWDRPITMTGRYPKSATNKQYGPEMAVTRGECLVLRRMFDVAVPVQEEINWPTVDNDRGRAGAPAREDGDTGDRANASVAGARPALHAAPDNSNVNADTGEVVPVTSSSRSFPAPRSQSAQNTDDLMQRLEEPFTDADASFVPHESVRDILRSVGALTPHQKAVLSGWLADEGDLVLPKSTRASVTFDHHDRIVDLIAAASAVAEPVVTE